MCRFFLGVRLLGLRPGCDLLLALGERCGALVRLDPVVQNLLCLRLLVPREVAVVITRRAASRLRRQQPGLQRPAATHPGRATQLRPTRIVEHDTIDTKVVELAKERGIVLAANTPEVGDLKLPTGAGFDAAFASDALRNHQRDLADLKAAAPSLAIELSFVEVTAPAQFRSAFSKIQAARAQALYVIEDGLFFAHAATINELALKARLPTISALKRVVEEGGFMSYGPSYADLFRRSAGYVDRILKGAKPGDLPVQQPTKFDLAVNLAGPEGGCTPPQLPVPEEAGPDVPQTDAFKELQGTTFAQATETPWLNESVLQN